MTMHDNMPWIWFNLFCFQMDGGLFFLTTHLRSVFDVEVRAREQSGWVIVID